jgi:hypothetical protein
LTGRASTHLQNSSGMLNRTDSNRSQSSLRCNVMFSSEPILRFEACRYTWERTHAITSARSLEEFFLLVRTSIIIRYVIRKNEDLPSSKVPSYLLACSVTFVSFFVSQIPVVFVQNGCRQPEHIFRKFRGSIKQKFLAGH